jgi:hypothetical protein
MDDTRATRLVGTALRCYPVRWRRRHGQEAAELAALLIEDGTPAASIALSYLAGAARERLTPPPGSRLTAAACALLVGACAFAASAGLLASAAPARAASAGTSTSSTSQAGPQARCRSAAPEPGPLVASAISRPQLIIWEAGHGRSC